LLTNSESVLEYYRKKYHFSVERSSVIPNGVYLSENVHNLNREEFKKELGVAPTEKIITCVASLTSQKDHITLLRSVKLILDQEKKDFKVLLVGEGRERKAIWSLCQALHLEDRVVFLGRRNDANDILSVSDIFVLSSLHEGMSNALLEAMAMKVPVVVSSIPENQELIIHDHNGLVFKVGDPESLAENILKGLNNPEEMRAFAMNSRLLIEEKYNINKIIKDIDDFLMNF
jgi:glycosyltransferase involved in cell wall biosynthesis